MQPAKGSGPSISVDCSKYLPRPGFRGGALRASLEHDTNQETQVMTTTNEIADKIAAEQNVSKAQAKAIVESVFKQISDAAGSGAETSIPGFGKFKVKDTPAREGRNPSTGATIQIAAAKKLSFTPAKAIKDALNG
jgi:DNA-binding protein HU-beta